MRTLSIRLLTVALLASPVTMIALPLDQAAGAATPATTCSVLAGPVAGPGRLSGCTRSTTGGRGTFELATAGRRLTTDIVHWKNGGTTTFKFTNGATRPRRAQQELWHWASLAESRQARGRRHRSAVMWPPPSVCPATKEASASLLALSGPSDRPLDAQSQIPKASSVGT